MARDFKHFTGDILKKSKVISDYWANKAPIHVGVIAVRHFKKSFDDEGFTDVGLQKWQEVKRRLPPKRKGSDGTRQILHGNSEIAGGGLFNSIRYRPETRRSVIFSDVEYAAVHNEGLKAGRGKGFMMPKRQFMGHSAKLDEKIKERTDRDIKKIFNER